MVHGNSDIGTQVVRLMVHLVHMIYDTGRKDLLESYIKVLFCSFIYCLNNELVFESCYCLFDFSMSLCVLETAFMNI